MSSNGPVLAIDHLYLGNTNTNGTASSTAWMQFGFDVDGVVSSATSTGLCKPVGTATPASVYPDGNGGIDNSFGKNILPQLLQLSATLPTQVNDNIAAGGFTMMMLFEGLTSSADQSPVSAKLYAGADMGHPAAFDGTDCWPVRPELLSNPMDISTSTVVFDSGALTGNTWSSGIAPSLALAFPTPYGPIKLTIHHAQMSLDLQADHKGGLSGQIGGVLDTQELITAVKAVVPPALAFVCGLVPGMIEGASDIMADGTQNPAQTCNGISIGLGFTAREVQLGGIAAPTPAGTPTCP